MNIVNDTLNIENTIKIVRVSDDDSIEVYYSYLEGRARCGIKYINEAEILKYINTNLLYDKNEQDRDEKSIMRERLVKILLIITNNKNILTEVKIFVDLEKEPNRWVRAGALFYLHKKQAINNNELIEILNNDNEKWVTNTCLAILSLSISEYKSLFLDQIRKKSTSALRALRYIYIPEATDYLIEYLNLEKLKKRQCDSTQHDSIKALYNVPPSSNQSNIVTKSLMDALKIIKYVPWLIHERVFIIIAIGKQKKKYSLDLLLEEITNENDQVSKFASYAIHDILETDETVSLLVSSAIEYDEFYLERFSIALRHIANYTKKENLVFDLLEIALNKTSQEHKEKILKLFVLAGGIAAYNKHKIILDSINKSEQSNNENNLSFEKDIRTVLKDSRIVYISHEAIFLFIMLIGVGLLASTAINIIINSDYNLAASLFTAGSGVISMIISSLVFKPLKKSKEIENQRIKYNMILVNFLQTMNFLDTEHTQLILNTTTNNFEAYKNFYDNYHKRHEYFLDKIAISKETS